MSFTALKTIRPFFTDQCGRLLAGGKIYTYEPGTLTPKPTYKDPAGLTENTNPIVLDTSGEADIYINSDYRFQIFSRDDVLIDDYDSIAATQRISSAFLSDPSGLTQEQINAGKEDKLNKGVALGYPSLDANTKVPVAQQYEASTTQKGITQLVNDLTTGGTDKAPTAEALKNLYTAIRSTHTGSVRQYHQRIPNSNTGVDSQMLTGTATVTISPNNDVYIPFPFAFPTAATAVFALNGDSRVQANFSLGGQFFSRTGFYVRGINISTNHDIRVDYLAFGY